MKVLNLDSNLIYKLPHQVDQKSMADLQVIEDFLVIAREAPKQSKSRLSTLNTGYNWSKALDKTTDLDSKGRSSQSQSFFDHCLATLTEKYITN